MLTDIHFRILIAFTGNQYRAFRKAHTTLIRMGVDSIEAARILLDAYDSRRIHEAYRSTVSGPSR